MRMIALQDVADQAGDLLGKRQEGADLRVDATSKPEK
jgi:hypothetical protein